MNESPRPEAAAKAGRIAGFRSCSDEYLELIRADLAPDCSADDMRRLRAFFSDLGGDPTVAELRFDLALLRSSRGRSDTVRVGSLRSDDPAAAQLFCELTAAYRRRRPRSPAPPPLCDLAAFAALRAGFDGNLTVSVSPAEAPLAPAFTGTEPEHFFLGDAVISVSRGSVRRGFSQPYASLLQPGTNQSTEEYLTALSRLTRALYDEAPEDLILPLTYRGLLADLAALGEDFRIRTTALPPRPASFLSVLSDYAPGVLVFSRFDRLDRIARAAARYGLGFGVPISASGGVFSVELGNQQIRFDRSYLHRLTDYSDLALTVGELNLEAAAEPSSVRPKDRTVTAIPVSGNGAAAVRASLADALGKKGDEPAAFALCGTLAPDDPGTAPLLLVLSSVCSAADTRMAAAHFEIGEKNTLTVFRIGGN